MDGHTSAAIANASTPRRVPSLAHRASGPARRRVCVLVKIAQRKSRMSRTRLVSIKSATQPVSRSDAHGESCSSNARSQTTRKRWRGTNTADAASLGDPSQRPVKSTALYYRKIYKKHYGLAGDLAGDEGPDVRKQRDVIDLIAKQTFSEREH